MGLVIKVPILALGVMIGLGMASNLKAQDQPSVAIMNILPLGYMKANNEMTGFYHDLSRLVEWEAGVDFNHTLLSPPRAARSFYSGEVDFIVTGAESKLFQKGISLGLFGCHSIGIVTRANSQIKSIKTLKGKSIGVITGGYIDKKYSGVLGYKAISSGTGQSLVAMLFHDRVDGIFLTDLMFLGYVHDPMNRKFVPQNWPELTGTFVHVEKFEVVLRISNVSPYQQLNEKLRKAIQKVRQNGEVRRIYQRYAPELDGTC